MLRKISWFFLILGLLLGSVTTYAVWRNTLPLVSPIALIEVITGNAPSSKSKKIVYGFFPYWNLKYVNELNISQLTHFAYFAVDLNPDGTINKINSKKEQEPGWNKLNSSSYNKLHYQTKLLGQKSALTVTAMDQELIDSLTNNQLTSKTAVKSIIEVYQEKKFDDINVDFEYIGTPLQSTRDGFSFFVRHLKESCLTVNAKCQVDVDIFADSAEKYRLWDLASLNQTVDHFIVMAYDYYRKNSTQSGPVAPITGKCNSTTAHGYPCLEQDIVTHLSQITKILPSEKILLGIPFYGYEWQTAGTEYLSNTYAKTGSMASYQRIQSLFSDPTVSSLSAQWSSVSLSPYITYTKNDKTFQIQFENAQSLEQKIKLIKSANLGGIAIWALGYETPFNDLWQPIKDLSAP
ncbi:hypothetical protein A3K29_00505 [Candidatus Collierbacteria bacterium RIFOXYB2_FULL_46_14]|uniref:GH18 domain-containing protein n=1 Tax=Candidatus Collierbacteria bacterium GW2011_GWA2_46_26 TaxID=1618381 RepID=A0A0G1PLK0_9BACT|nr:MAG: hypothetical protein UW29_C0001G0077 [Candidatus Collierbacteria bacterium GW2011_GWC2_44_13]KKU33669.1 MAG: hypothetical protein UX47_C0002G0077 [Candidatus Collierbacteria bacterium GW2011_GWA2_46_26]OGD72617.1 MAG: hypothetical protein A3K29_00505 [Candidatus Collierbacteria bacterium RIFOXYB2_FULL_46_14]OGD75659.1 MAG: hypothetical protein A3K43_00505 [Candidatus Collierbacteria bacterium RIFOXYA2_FULL_46_20]OGD76995.1 MAG: hypothetical protein A3K39_00505 [Candidatus Collierbacteri